MTWRWPFLILLVVLVAGDLASKHAVFDHLRGYDVIDGTRHIDVVDGFFRLTVVRNQGVTFGLGQGLGPIWAVLNIVAIVVLAVVYWRTRREQRFQAVALILVLAGAVGNLYDRLRFGWVRDFLDVYVGRHHWPPFNVADASIVVGVVILALVLWRTPAPEKDAA
jgi:signal peptidase II